MRSPDGATAPSLAARAMAGSARLSPRSAEREGNPGPPSPHSVEPVLGLAGGKTRGLHAGYRPLQAARSPHLLRALAPHGHQDRHDGGAEEQADQSEAFQAAENAEQDPEEGQAGRVADQHRPHEMIGDEDQDRAERDQRDRGGRMPLHQQREGTAREDARPAAARNGPAASPAGARPSSTGWGTPAIR